MFGEQVIVTVMSPSVGVPEEGETRIQLSVEETVQFRLQENAKLCVPPFRVNELFRGPVIVTKGAFSQEDRRAMAQRSARTK